MKNSKKPSPASLYPFVHALLATLAALLRFEVQRLPQAVQSCTLPNLYPSAAAN